MLARIKEFSKKKELNQRVFGNWGKLNVKELFLNGMRNGSNHKLISLNQQ